MASPAMPTGDGEPAIAALQMKDMGCKACGQNAASTACEALCLLPPAIAAAGRELDQIPSPVAWDYADQPTSTRAVAPDSSPPRA